MIKILGFLGVVSISCSASQSYSNGDICDDCDSVVIIKGVEATNNYFENKGDTLFDRNCSWREIAIKSKVENGFQYNYSNEGVLKKRLNYDKGELTDATVFDSVGNVSEIVYYKDENPIKVRVLNKSGIDSMNIEVILDTLIETSMNALGEDSVIKITKDDKMILYNEYYSNGQLKITSTKSILNPSGLIYEYYEDGKIYCKHQYSYDEFKGLQCYYQSGKLMQIVQAKKGEWHGQNRVYYENGKIKFISNYLNGRFVGVKQCFDQKGKKTNFGSESLECND